MHRYKWLTPIALTLFLVTTGCGNTTNNTGSAGFSYNAIGTGGNSGSSMNNHVQRQNRTPTTSANAVTFLPMTMQVMQIDPGRKVVMVAIRDAKSSKNRGGTAAQAANLPGPMGTSQNITIPVGWTLHVSGPTAASAGSGKLLGDGVISVLRYPLTNSPGMGSQVTPQMKKGKTAITNTPQADTWGLRGTNVTTVVGGPVAARGTTFKATIPGEYAIVWASAGGPPHVLSRMTVSNSITKPFLATVATIRQ